MEDPARARGGGGGGARGGARRGHGGPRIPNQIPRYAPQKSNTPSHVGFVIVPPANGPVSFSTASPQANAPRSPAVTTSPGRGGRGRGSNRGRGRGRGRGISTTSHAVASPSPAPAPAPAAPAPEAPSVKPNIGPRAPRVRHAEIQALRDARAANTEGYEKVIVETVEKMLASSKGKPSQQTKAYMNAAARSPYGSKIPAQTLFGWIEALVRSGDFSMALGIIESGKIMENFKYEPRPIVLAAIESPRHRAAAVSFICRYPDASGLAYAQVLTPLVKSGEWASLLRIASVFKLAGFSRAVLDELHRASPGLARAWADDLVELLHLTLNPLSLATLSSGATTYWIDTPEAVVALAQVLRQQKNLGGHALQKRGLPFSLILGFDVESRPSFQAGQRNRPSILQLSSFITIALVDLHRPEVLEQMYHSFAPLLSAPDVLVCGAGIWNDFAEIERPPRSVMLPPMSAVLDLSEAFLSLWPGFVQKPGLKRLVAYTLGLKINKLKAVQTSNWDNRPLQPAQLSYAAEDVNVLPHVAAILLEQLPANSPVIQAAVARPRKDSKRTILAPAKRTIMP